MFITILCAIHFVTMALSKYVNNLENAIDNIRKKRHYSPFNLQGAIMIKCHVTHDINLDGIDIYYAKNPKHFWLGKVESPHVTVHHGFDLQRYEEDGSGKEGFTEDVEAIIGALDKDDLHNNPFRKQTFRKRLLEGVISARPSFFPPNPALLANGEDNYYTIILESDPTEELEAFQKALLQVFPHTIQFPDWRVHASVVTVASEKSRDLLLGRLQDSSIKMKYLFIGYNIKR